MKNLLIDSSCWIEILSTGVLAKKCEKELKSSRSIIVPTLVLYEVYRKIKSALSDEDGLTAIAYLSQFTVSPLTREIALLAADLSLEHKLGTADSLILAHAQETSATLITLDNDFRGLPDVKVLS